MNRLFLANQVESALIAPMAVEGEPEAVRCYVRIYYVWAKDKEDAEGFIKLDLSQEAELIDMGVVEEVRLEDIRADVRQAIAGEAPRGVCWRSGRIFFPCDSDEGRFANLARDALDPGTS